MQEYIFGRNAIIEAISSGTPIEKIFILFGAQGDAVHKIFAMAKKENIPCVQYDKNKFLRLEKDVVPKGEKAQSAIALVSLYKSIDIDELIEISFQENKHPVVVILDEIADPHNLGAIARSTECSGAVGLIISERDSSPITPVAIKASAGALQHIPVVKSGNLIHSIEQLKEAGFWVFGTDAIGDRYYSDSLYDSPVAVIIGSEGKGIRPSIAKHCDYLIRIPLNGEITSLNSSVSAGIILFEIQRQKLEMELKQEKV